MERSEPTLIPEWLKNAGNSNGGSVTSPHSDNHSASRIARNKSFVNYNHNVNDSPRSSSSSEKTTSSYFRRSSSTNGTGRLRSNGSFGRNHRDRDKDNKEIYNFRDKHKRGYLWDFPDTLIDPISSKFERDGLRRSQSMISGKRGGTWTKKVGNDSKDEDGNYNYSNNGVLKKTGSIIGVNEQNFERDFPSLSADGQIVASEIDRVSSPGLGSALQSLPIGTSVVLDGEKWTSALAEVPALVGSNGTATSSVQQNAPSGLKSMASGLNMAEAVVLGPTRSQTPPQSSLGTQRLEELVIKQSRQLIPVTPLLPKTLVSISSEKQKTKASHQQFPGSSSVSLNQSPRGGPVKGDVSKASDVAKLHVLKPGREKNGSSPVSKDNSSPKNGGITVNSLLSTSPFVSVSASTKAPQVNNVPDHSKVVLEKKPNHQAKSRKDFFNSVRKQSMANSSSLPESALVRDTGNATSASLSDKLTDIEVVTPQLVNMSVNSNLEEDNSSEHLAQMACNRDYTCNVKRHINPCPDPIISEEEEAAFLRSLGWEEDDDEGGLTEEEINAFYRDLSKYINSNTASLRILQSVQHKLLLPQISGLSSSDAMES